MNHENEKKILWGFTSSGYYQENYFPQIKAEYFEDEKNQILFQSMHDLYKEKTYLDLSDFKKRLPEYLQGYAEHIIRLQEQPEMIFLSDVNFENWVKDLRDCYNKRKIGSILDDLKANIIGSNKDPLTAFREASRLFESTIENCLDLSEYKNTAPVSLLNNLEKIINQKVKFYNTGEHFKELNLGNNNLIRDGLITIGGNAGKGKTSFVGHLSIELLRNNPETAFLFYTLDDSEGLAGKRIFSQIAGIDFFREPFKISSNINDIAGRIFVKENLSLFTIRQDIESIRSQAKAQAVIIAVDYLQICPAPGDSALREKFNFVVKYLKDTQKEAEKEGGCILFLLSQLKRDSGKDFNYRETSEIENVSDVCIDIEDEGTEGTKKLIVKKNKLGKKGYTLYSEINGVFQFEPLRTQQEVFYNDKVDNPFGSKNNTKKTDLLSARMLR